MRTNFKKVIRWGGILLLTALLTPTAVLFMLYTPALQQVACKWSTEWLTKQTGIEIGVKELRLRYPLQIEIQDIRVGRFLSIDRFSTNIRLRPLTEGILKADYIHTKGFNFHTDTLTATVPADITAQQFNAINILYNWRERDGHIQHILLADGYIKLQRDTQRQPKDSKPTKLPLSISIANTQLRQIGASYTDSQMSMQSIIGKIALHDTAVDTTSNVELRRAEIMDGSFTLKQKDRETWGLTELNAQADSLRYSPTAIAGKLTQLTFKESHGIRLHKGRMAFTWQDGAIALPYFDLHTGHSTFNGHLHTWSHSTGLQTVSGKANAKIGYYDVRLLAKQANGMAEALTTLYPPAPLSASIALNGTMEHLQLTQCNLSLPTAFDINMSGAVHNITYPRHRQAECRIEAQTYDLSFLTALADSVTKKRLTIPNDMTCQGELHYAPDTLHAHCILNIDKGTVILDAGYRPTGEDYTLHVQTDSLDIKHIVPYSKAGEVTLQAHLQGSGIDYTHDESTTYGTLLLHSLQWGEQTFSNASAQIAVTNEHLHAYASYSDSLMQWSMTTAITYSPDTLNARLHARITDMNLRALHIADSDIRPTLQCSTTLHIDTAMYSLHSRFSDIALNTATQSIQPHPLDLYAILTTDTARIGIRSGDLTLTADAHTERLPWQRQQAIDLTQGKFTDYFSNLRAVLSAGDDNPISNYLALTGMKLQKIHATINEQKGKVTGHIAIGEIMAKGIRTDSIAVAAHYADGTLCASLHTGEVVWSTPQMQLQGKASATLAWGGTFNPDSLTGLLCLSSIYYTIPAYSLQLRSIDTLSIPLKHGALSLTALPLYATGKQPLLIDGRIALLGNTPTVQLHLTARDTNLLQADATRTSLLYGKTLMSGSIALNGPFDALSITGNLRLRPGSSIHYIYKDAILTANNQLDNVVTFTSLNTDIETTVPPKRRFTANGLSMNLNIEIDPTVELEVSLGASLQNSVTLQGGGTLHLQYIPAGGLRLSGKYTIESGELNMNIPLLHANHMNIRSGSTVIWSGNLRNPQLDITAEERIRASVTLNSSPQSVLFTAGMSLTNTVEKLGIQFTLAAPENASMQNTLAALSSEERSKLSVALLTTGLYLGEGGTGKLMNTALMSMLQSQIDNISRDAFRTVNVSVGIEPLPDGVSGISTRTDYSFSLAKRLWNDRIRIIIGGSVTTTGERIENDAVIDNISIEWRITPIGNQYLRFFYDKNYESILEGEIRETGVGYMYRRSF